MYLEILIALGRRERNVKKMQKKETTNKQNANTYARF